jgi:hypothetical protein
MARALLLMALLAAVASPVGSARGEVPLNLGTAPNLAWGEHQLALAGGWPVQSVGLSWGTALGWNPGVYGALDIRAPAQTWALGMSFCRPFAHGARTSLFFHFAGGALLQVPGTGARLGGEGQTGLTLGVGLGQRRRVTYEVGLVPSFQFGPGIADLRPVLRLRAQSGFTAWLGPEVGLAIRGRIGMASRAGTVPRLDWAAGLEFDRLF